jgi:hypothetical protein
MPSRTESDSPTSSSRDHTADIWLPESEMTVTIQDGQVYIRESMVMVARPVTRPVGFKSE